MENIISTSSNKIPTKLIVIGILILVLVLGLVASLFLVRQNQDIKQEAAVSTGVVKAYLTPETKNVNAGDEFTADILLDTSGQYISALTLQLEFTYSGDAPIDATDIATNTALVTTDEWTFPVKTVTNQTGKTIIRIAGFNKLQTGWASSGETKIATVTFEAYSSGKIEVSFNPSESKVTSKTTTQDILLIPSSKGIFTSTGGNNEASPTPTGSSAPTPTGSGSFSSKSPSPASSGSPTPVPIPETGASTPTIIGIGIGALLLIGSIVFAF